MTRLNARLGPDLEAKLEFLKRRTKKNATEIVRESIEMYYWHTREGSSKSGRAAFDQSGFVGCADAEEGLSSGYKQILADQLERKTGKP